jgi:CDGSH-type Zn-finger protein
MSEVNITKLDHGPLLVKGTIQLQDGSGNTYEVKEQTYLCRCGHTTNAPFCTGAHKAAGFQESSSAIKS